MSTRVQTINSDTVLEVTETVVKKRRHSEANLLRQRAYFQSMVDKGTAGLERVNALLQQISNAKDK